MLIKFVLYRTKQKLFAYRSQLKDAERGHRGVQLPYDCKSWTLKVGMVF